MTTFRADSETYPIRPGLLTPKMVCIQYALDEAHPKILLRKDAGGVLEDALDSTALLEFHNGAYDMAVFANEYPHLLPKIFKTLGD